MPQKFCCRCNKELSTAERAGDQIQCARCYERWLHETLPAAEPIIHRIIAELRKPGPSKTNSA
jgi:hypothetical protein